MAFLGYDVNRVDADTLLCLQVDREVQPNRRSEDQANRRSEDQELFCSSRKTAPGLLTSCSKKISRVAHKVRLKPDTTYDPES